MPIILRQLNPEPETANLTARYFNQSRLLLGAAKREADVGDYQIAHKNLAGGYWPFAAVVANCWRCCTSYARKLDLGLIMTSTMKRYLALFFYLVGLHFSFTATTAEAQVQGDASASVPAVRPEEKEQLGRRLASVATLIEKSSAGKQIESSAIPEALAKRDKARELRLEAERAYRSENYPNASRLLDQAAKMMFEGVRLASPEQVTQEKKQRDFDSRMESVKALLSAQKRISIEKNAGAKGKEISNKIETQMQEASALANAKKLDQARALLDQAYVTAKKAIESMRDGDTLVRSLDFATKEEEYRYEIDRNDTHQMLVKVLLDEKRAVNPSLEGMVQKYLEQAASLRKTAESSASKGDYVMGIKLLEDSTKELVRAIRGAGVYIPG
jgi:hypothetical protein